MSFTESPLHWSHTHPTRHRGVRGGIGGFGLAYSTRTLPATSPDSTTRLDVPAEGEPTGRDGSRETVEVPLPHQFEVGPETAGAQPDAGGGRGRG